MARTVPALFYGASLAVTSVGFVKILGSIVYDYIDEE